MSVLELAVPAERMRPTPSEACRAARAVQPLWAARSLADRAAVVHAAAVLMAREADAMASVLAASTRRPRAELWSGEILPTLDALRWLARDGARVLRPRSLSRARLQWYFRAARHELLFDPYGVIGIVTPANAPLFLAIPQMAAALVAGNAVVWKPAPAAGDTAGHVLSLFGRAGLPAGVLQAVHGGAETARALVRAGVDKLHFTGGTAAGLELYWLQAARGRPAVLELSGRHVAVVLDDADAQLAARGIVWAKLANGGRNCITVQLVLATSAIAPRLVQALTDAMKAAPAPLLDVREQRRLTALVDDAVGRGARLVHAGPWPVLVADVVPGMRVVEEEIQGPVLAVATVPSAAHAVAWTNAAAHRLSASLWTSSPARARALARHLDVGQVWINDQLQPAAHPEVTLAGRGASGFGASRGLAGLMEMVQPKVVSEMPLRVRRRHYGAAASRSVELFRATARLAATRGVLGRLRALASLARAGARLLRSAS